MGTNIDTSRPTWKNDAIVLPEVRDAIKSGVYTALIGSGWSANPDTVADCIGHVTLLLLDSYLDKWAGYQGKNKNQLAGFCRWVAYQKTINFVQLKVHEHDGAVDRMVIDATDATADDATPRVVTDETWGLGFLRVEQRERLTNALEALETDERSHIVTLLNGGSSAEWGAENGMTPVQTTRHKQAVIAKLARLVADE